MKKNETIIWMQVLDFKKFGGAEVFSLRLANGLMDKGYNPIIFAAHRGWKLPSQEYYTFEKNGVAILRLPSPNIWLFGSFIYVIFVTLYLAIYYSRVKVVHASSINRVAAAVIFLSRCLGKKVISRSIGGDVWLLEAQVRKNNLLARFHIFALRFAHKIVSQGRDGIDILKELGIRRSRLEQIGNGVNTLQYKPYQGDRSELCLKLGISVGEEVVCCVNRLHPLKRVDLIITAFAKLKSDMRDVQLVVVGEGELRGELEQLADKLGVEGSVIFVGNVETPLEFLQCSDVFVLASDKENYSNALLEAMSCGIPVVATKVGGNKEIVQHGENGLLVARSSVSEITQAISKILQDKELAARLGNNARQSIVEKYSFERVVERYLSLYDLPF